MSLPSCPHYDILPFSKLGPHDLSDPLLKRLQERIDREKGCQTCGNSAKTTYICLNDDCFFVGCGRDDKRHALDHYRQKHKPNEKKSHNIVLNIQSFQCWCYDCDDAFSPPIFLAMEPDFETPAISSVASSTSNSKRKNGRSSLIQHTDGVVGLYNLGNSCYMNAALQALLNWYLRICSSSIINDLNSPSILGYFRKCSAFIYRHNNRRITEGFHKLVDTIYSSNLPVVSPSRLVREVKLINPQFHGYSQQDTMDFIRCLFERIHDEVKFPKFQKTDKQGNLDSTINRRRSMRIAKQDIKNSTNSKEKEQPTYRSIISDTFGGVLRSEILCLNCQNISVKDDPFFDVSIQICSSPEGPKGQKSSLGYIGNLFNSIGETIGLNGKPVKLETCLAAFCAHETLDGKDRYRCEKCKQLVPSKKTLKFKELPQILCLQLKRFRHESYFSSKIGTHVICPHDNLDMTPYLHESTSQQAIKETRYYLTALISHRGTFSGGHYIAYCKNPNNGQWLEFDDSVVSVVSEEEIQKVQAYALFYSLVDWNARKERKEWAPLIDKSIPETSDGVFISRYWYNEWLTMSDPGPLDNSDITCQHGSLMPEKLVDPMETIQFIPKEVYDYFVNRYGEVSGLTPLNSSKICQSCFEEEQELDRRRQQEEKDIQALDTSTIRPGEYWYLISSDWLVRWGQFKSSAADPPGPISNDRLIKEDSLPRQNLVRGTHYRGVNRRVWDYFYKIYGGGPTIVRKSINIYGPAPENYQETDSATEDIYVDVVGH